MAATTNDEILISADSHVVEDPELWVKRVPAALRDQAPKFGEQDLRGFTKQPGGWNPSERIKEMETDGVSAEVLYPSLGLRLYDMQNGPLQEACFRAYNDWIIEFCQVAPERLVGIACISCWDIERGVAEMERCRKAGLRGALIWEVPDPALPFRSAHYDPMWAASQDLEMPMNLHILTQANPNRAPLEGASSGLNRLYNNVNNRIGEVASAVFDFVAGGILHRYPGMKIVLVENEVGWLPFYLQQWDYYYSGKQAPSQSIPIDRDPSAYFHDQVLATFFNDPAGGQALSWWGQDNCMWSNDYPHPNSTWPNSRQVIARDLGHLPSDIRAKVVRENVAKLYGLKIPTRA